MLLVLGGVVLFYDDKQQRGDLLKEQQENALLSQEVADKDRQIQATARQLSAPYSQPAPANGPLTRSGGNPLQTGDSDPLNRPAYK